MRTTKAMAHIISGGIHLPYETRLSIIYVNGIQVIGDW